MWGVVVNADVFPARKPRLPSAPAVECTVRAELERHLQSCSPPPSAFVRKAVEAFLAHTPAHPHPEAPYLWRLRDIDPLPTFVRDRVALVGDAAHAALPWTGLGISAAALDAQRLADELARAQRRECTVAEALRAYDADRRPRGHAVQKAARASDGGQGPQAYRMGRLALRVLPLKLLYGVQDALVRDCGGAVQDGAECRTAGADLGSRIWGQKMGSEGSRLADSERGVWFSWKKVRYNNIMCTPIIFNRKCKLISFQGRKTDSASKFWSPGADRAVAALKAATVALAAWLIFRAGARFF